MSADPCPCECTGIGFPIHGTSLIAPTGACPSFWRTCQGGDDVRENIATTEGKIILLDRTDVRHNEVMPATRTKLEVVVGLLTTETETGIHAFVLHSLFGEACSVVEAILPLVEWIDQNWKEWFWIMAYQETTTRFAYNV